MRDTAGTARLSAIYRSLYGFNSTVAASYAFRSTNLTKKKKLFLVIMFTVLVVVCFRISSKHPEFVYGGERLWVPIADGVSRIPSSAFRLAEQRLGGGEVALVLQQRTEVVHEDERVRMPIAKGLT